MSLLGVVLQVVGGVAVLLVVAAVGILGRSRLDDAASNAIPHTRAVTGPVLVLGVTLALNGVLRDVSADLSWDVGFNVTGIIYGIEGNYVSFVQSFASPLLTAVLSFVYVFGYAFLLVFPLLVCYALPQPRQLRTLLIAYVVNYVLGLLFYLVVIAYGPRNLLPDLVDSLLYKTYPQFQLLTSEVNVNTNVFPSLHASLAVTVALLAARVREQVPRWYPVALLGAISVCLSTLYLGIHWTIDVAGGILLAVVAVKIASMDRWH